MVEVGPLTGVDHPDGTWFTNFILEDFMKNVLKISMAFLMLSIFISLAFASPNATFISNSVPAYMCPGTSIPITITVQNTGTTTWVPNQYWLSVNNNGTQHPLWGVISVPVPSTINPGSLCSFNFSVTAPNNSGSNDFNLVMSSTSYPGGFGSWKQIWVTVKSGAYLPSQFIAKLYTEALGRAPEQGAWDGWHQYFKTNGCNLASIQAFALNVFTTPGGEFEKLGYDNEEKVITMYRALQSRDPDAGGFSLFVALLKAGHSITELVNDITSSGEFAGLVNQIFSGYSYGWKTASVPNYATTWTVPPVPPSSTNIYPFPAHPDDPTTGTALKTLLDSRQSGDIVLLPEKLIVVADVDIVIPAGVTLRTYSPSTITQYQYARFARIVRSASNIPAIPPAGSDNYTNLVQLESGARLEHVFVDGSRSVVGILTWGSANIGVHGGTNTTVNECRSSNVGSATPIFVWEIGGTSLSNNVSITNNLVTCYETSNSLKDCITPYFWPWSDGITNGCLHANITGNNIIDPTDCGIVTFGYDHDNWYPQYPQPVQQQSQIIGNTIVNAGNSCNAEFNLDGAGAFQKISNANTLTIDFTNCKIANNSIMMGRGPNIHCDLIFETDTRAWFGNIPQLSKEAHL